MDTLKVEKKKLVRVFINWPVDRHTERDEYEIEEELYNIISGDLMEAEIKLKYDRYDLNGLCSLDELDFGLVNDTEMEDFNPVFERIKTYCEKHKDRDNSKRFLDYCSKPSVSQHQ